MQAVTWGASAAFACLAVVSALAERRRERRRDIDGVGWVPWPTILLLSILLAVVLLVIGLKAQ
jgi:hypothetical protein